MPMWLVTVCLVALLGYTARKTLIKAFAAWAKENAATFEEAKTKAPRFYRQLSGSRRLSQEDALKAAAMIDEAGDPATASTEWANPLAASLLEDEEAAAAHPSAALAALVEMTAALLALLTHVVGHRLARTHEAKRRLGYAFAEGDPQWEARNLTVLPLLCTVAGVAAGGLGVGGAMVKGPLMLEMGMQPAVSSATASFMILMTASITTLQFLVAGLLRPDYTLWYALVGALGTITGQTAVGAIVKRTKRQSVLALALGINIAVSAVVMGLIGALQVVSDARSADWDAFAWQPLCK